MIEVKGTEMVPKIEETEKTEEINVIQNVKDQGTNRLIEINEVQEEKLTLKPRRRKKPKRMLLLRRRKKMIF
jgi:hypothetical protein